MNLDFLDNIGDRSIVILSTPRTGSTALCNVIEVRCNAINLAEYFNVQYNLRERYWQCFNHKTVKTVIKIFPDHHNNFTTEEFKKILENSFVIYLDRANILDQMTSFYILCETKNAKYKKSEILNDYYVVEDYTTIKSRVELLLSLRKQAEIYKSMADICLVYEDIVDLLENNKIQKYHKPVNYDRLKNLINSVLLEKNKD